MLSVFPAGIMQFPFLSSGVPNYVTYAMVGAVISHELSHAFDDQGNFGNCVSKMPNSTSKA